MKCKRYSATHRKHLLNRIQILSELFDKKSPKLESVLSRRKFDPPDLNFCRFVIDG